MLNEERIKIMTKMASYEENEGKSNMSIGSYFRGDYIGLQVLKSVIGATLSFLIGFGIFIFYDFEKVMKDIYQVDLLGLGKKILIIYIVFVGIYAILAYLLYAYRYNRAKKSLRKYYARLKELSELYHEDSRR